MRLIDADALTDFLKCLVPDRGMWEIEGDTEKDAICETVVEAMEMVKNMDTIEPRPGGRWEEKGIAFIRDTNIEKVQEMRCSECKRWLITPYRRYLTIHKFCPNCGADMRPREE